MGRLLRSNSVDELRFHLEEYLEQTYRLPSPDRERVLKLITLSDLDCGLSPK